MQLTELQKDKVRQWAAEGASLSRIQDLLREELDIRMSFIDVRFLVLDLNATIKEKEKPKEIEKSRSPEVPTSNHDENTESTEDTEEDDFEPSPDPAHGTSTVSVSLSRIAQPGFAVCGDVTFSDGVKANWGITARGELSLAGAAPDYRPSQADVREFQTQLRNLLSGGGY